jgi:hypothetical protein
MIAVMLQIENARHVHGVSEVSALHRSTAQYPYVHSNGMTPIQIVDYLRTTSPGPELWGDLMTSQRNATKRSDNRFQSLVGDFAWGMHCYVSSGVPILLQVDLTHFQSVLKYNSAPASILENWGPDRDRPHIVVVGGVKAPDAAPTGIPALGACRQLEFVVHCTATLPFLTVAADVLYRAGLGFNTDQADASSYAHKERTFIPVTPRNVKVPLLPTMHSNLPSISDIAWFHQNGNSKENFDVGSFRLINIRDLQKLLQDPQSFYDHFLTAFDFPEDVLTELTNHLDDLSDIVFKSNTADDDFYFWVQHQTGILGFDNLLNIWSAEVDPAVALELDNFSTTQQILAFLNLFFIAKISKNSSDGLWTFSANDDFNRQPANFPLIALNSSMPLNTEIAPIEDNVLTRAEKQWIVPAMINSFDPQSRMGGFWPNPALACEYYAFMESTVQQMTTAGVIPNVASAVDLLALIDRNASMCDAVSDWMIQTTPVQIVALASFFQEHSAEPQSERARIGTEALRGLCSLAISLRRRGAPLQSVEIVCGSRLLDVEFLTPLSLWESPDHRKVIAPHRDPKTAIHHLLMNLHKALIVPPSSLGERLHESGIRLLLELEPGLFFTLNGLSSLRLLASAIAKEPGLGKVLYFNLDVSHFLQANIYPHDLLKNPQILNRISHVHVSGCDRRGHFGDTSAVSFQDYEAILRTIVRLNAEQKRCLVISGEMEAARDIETVVRTAHSLIGAISHL